MVSIISFFAVVCLAAILCSFFNYKIDESSAEIAQRCDKKEAESQFEAEKTSYDLFGNAIYPDSFDEEICSPFAMLESSRVRLAHSL